MAGRRNRNVVLAALTSVGSGAAVQLKCGQSALNPPGIPVDEF